MQVIMHKEKAGGTVKLTTPHHTTGSYLQAKARIWPGLSYMCHVRSTTVTGEPVQAFEAGPSSRESGLVNGDGRDAGDHAQGEGGRDRQAAAQKETLLY